MASFNYTIALTDIITNLFQIGEGHPSFNAVQNLMCDFCTDIEQEIEANDQITTVIMEGLAAWAEQTTVTVNGKDVPLVKRVQSIIVGESGFYILTPYLYREDRKGTGATRFDTLLEARGVACEMVEKGANYLPGSMVYIMREGMPIETAIVLKNGQSRIINGFVPS